MKAYFSKKNRRNFFIIIIELTYFQVFCIIIEQIYIIFFLIDF